MDGHFSPTVFVLQGKNTALAIDCSGTIRYHNWNASHNLFSPQEGIISKGGEGCSAFKEITFIQRSVLTYWFFLPRVRRAILHDVHGALRWQPAVPPGLYAAFAKAKLQPLQLGVSIPLQRYVVADMVPTTIPRNWMAFPTEPLCPQSSIQDVCKCKERWHPPSIQHVCKCKER